MTDDSDLITSAQAAIILGVSVRTVQRRARDGTLPPAAHVQAGNHGTFLFHRSDIEALAAEQDGATQTPAAAAQAS